MVRKSVGTAAAATPAPRVGKHALALPGSTPRHVAPGVV